MLIRGTTVFACVIFAACAPEPVIPPQTAEQADPRTRHGPWPTARIAEGRAVYERSCAACHDPGASEAPAIGVKGDWDNRSRLWTAVLFDHAKSGYLEMPSKGGAPGLSDQQVDAAAEYILLVTYPEWPAS